MNNSWFDDGEATLSKLVANILQTPQEKSDLVTSALMQRSAGAIGLTSVSVVALGIGMFSSEVANAASIGSMLAGSMAGNALIGCGIAAVGYIGVRLLYGQSVYRVDLTVEEKQIVNSSLSLVQAFRSQRTQDGEMTPQNAKIFLQCGWKPFVDSVADYQRSRASHTLNRKSAEALGIRLRELGELTGRLNSYSNAHQTDH